MRGSWVSRLTSDVFPPRPLRGSSTSDEGAAMIVFSIIRSMTCPRRRVLRGWEWCLTFDDRSAELTSNVGAGFVSLVFDFSGDGEGRRARVASFMPDIAPNIRCVDLLSRLSAVA